MDQERAEMRQAMEASIQQRVADEAGTNPKHYKTYKTAKRQRVNLLKLALPAFSFLLL